MIHLIYYIYDPFDSFPINCGVKQGGILSPYLFNQFIDDLISECTDLNKGALFGNLNVSILVYADDILLISPVDSHLQQMLDVWSYFSEKWRITFNPSKSNIIQLGKPFSDDPKLLFSNLLLNKAISIKYLGIEKYENFEFDSISLNKFKNLYFLSSFCD